MPDAPTLALFAAAALALLVVPGPAVLYIVAQSIEGGRRAGLVSMLGIQAGAAVHVAAAAVGLSSLLVSSAVAFEIVKYAGAAYLVYLGVRRLLTRAEADVERPRVRKPHAQLFRQGVVVQVLNPKTALFFFAFFPQFVEVDRAAAPQILVLGAVFVGLAVVSDGVYALTAGTLSERLRDSRRFLAAQRYVSGTVFVGLGAAAAVSGQRK